MKQRLPFVRLGPVLSSSSGPDPAPKIRVHRPVNPGDEEEKSDLTAQNQNGSPVKALEQKPLLQHPVDALLAIHSLRHMKIDGQGAKLVGFLA